MVWIFFLIAVALILALDLGVFNKTPHIISTKEASKWTLIWVSISFLFSGVIYWLYTTNYIENPDGLKPTAAAIKFITGYLIELSLSIDNIFVFILIFDAFKVKEIHLSRVLLIGILAAIVFRVLFITLGVALVAQFAWVLYIFGVFLCHHNFPHSKILTWSFLRPSLPYMPSMKSM